MNKNELSPFCLGVEFVDAPMEHFAFILFRDSLHEWKKKSPEVAQQMLDFLDGKQITSHGNRFEALVSERYFESGKVDDAAIIEQWLTGNPKFGVDVRPASLGIEASVVPESLHLISNTQYGCYRKLTVELDTVFRCTLPISDIDDSEIESPLPIDPESVSNPDMQRLRIIKAILQDPNRVYVGRLDRFVMLTPRNPEAAACLFSKEMGGASLLKNLYLAEYGRDFAPDKSMRKALGDGLDMFNFDSYDGQLTCMGYIGNLEAPGTCRVKFRLPFMDKRPDLFVQNVRKGLASIERYIGYCESPGRLENYAVKFGCFELETITIKNCRISRKTRWSEKAPGKPQWSDIELMEKLCNYLRAMRDFLNSVTDFLAFLLEKGTNDADSARENLIDLMVNQVQLDPLSYTEHELPCVREYANYCISGEWMPATEEDPELPF